MIPPLSPVPCRPNKFQPNGTTPGSVSQQGVQSNQFQGFFQNPSQFQAQAGMMMNQQMPMPLNNFVANLGNGSPAMPTVANVNDNPYIAMHKALSMLGMPNFMAQGQMPFGPQGSNPIPFVPMPMNQNQPMNQLLPHPPNNMPQLYNQNACFQNQQPILPSPMQNNNQFIPNLGQGMPCNMPPFPSQNFQPFGTQTPFGIVQPSGSMPQGNQSQNPFVPPHVNANSAKNAPTMNQPLQRNPSLSPATNSVTPRKAQQHFGPPGFPNQQINDKKDSENTHSSPNWKNLPNRHMGKNTKQDAFQRRLPNGKFQNGKRKFNQRDWHDKKDTFNNIETKTAHHTTTTNKTNDPHTRFLYRQDITQWIEERKKNYPSKANIDKKLAETDPAVKDSKAILRGQQLKQILARQAELGVEVAEIPEHYIVDSNKPANGQEEENGKLHKRGKKFKRQNRRGRHKEKNHGSNKKLKVDDEAFLNEKPAPEKTLLQKLMGEDIKREKIHLLQVFRFMTMNSFFKEWPEKPLVLPSVSVNEAATACVNGAVMAENRPGSGNNGDEVCGGVVKGGRNGAGGDVHEEEEGEIID